MDIGELPRDAKGNVIGGWHVTLCGSDVYNDRCVIASEIFGQMVERAVAIGCAVAPGPRPAEPEIVTPAGVVTVDPPIVEVPDEPVSPRPGRKRKPRTE